MRDIFGMFLSFLCIFHCIGLPFFLPLLKNYGVDLGVDNHTLHLSLLGIVTLYTAAFLWPYVDRIRFLISVIGLGLLYGAITLPEGMMETAVTIFGSLALMTAHYLEFTVEYDDEQDESAEAS